MCLQAISDADFVLANSDAARWHTSPLVKQGIVSDCDLPGLQNHVCKRAYVFIILRSNPSFLAFILPFHKNKPNARLSSVWLCMGFGWTNWNCSKFSRLHLLALRTRSLPRSKSSVKFLFNDFFFRYFLSHGFPHDRNNPRSPDVPAELCHKAFHYPQRDNHTS